MHAMHACYTCKGSTYHIFCHLKSLLVWQAFENFYVGRCPNDLVRQLRARVGDSGDAVPSFSIRFSCTWYIFSVAQVAPKGSHQVRDSTNHYNPNHNICENAMDSNKPTETQTKRTFIDVRRWHAILGSSSSKATAGPKDKLGAMFVPFVLCRIADWRQRLWTSLDQQAGILCKWKTILDLFNSYFSVNEPTLNTDLANFAYSFHHISLHFTKIWCPCSPAAFVLHIVIVDFQDQWHRKYLARGGSKGRNRFLWIVLRTGRFILDRKWQDSNVKMKMFQYLWCMVQSMMACEEWLVNLVNLTLFCNHDTRGRFWAACRSVFIGTYCGFVRRAIEKLWNLCAPGSHQRRKKSLMFGTESSWKFPSSWDFGDSWNQPTQGWRLRVASMWTKHGTKSI